ncbi:MAG: hypothetical protein IJT44_00965 [Clostridia bacterium]|nr:hypothetical protein [Clostridia bacterium]
MKSKNESKTAQTEIASTVTFKKVTRGYDPEEVLAYIEEMDRTMKDASKNYEKRMAEMKSALALANRERDKVLARYGGESEKKEEDSTDADQSQLDEAQAAIAGLKDKIEEMQASRIQMEAEMQKKVDDERAARESLERELETSAARIEGLKQQIEQQQSLQTQYEQALGTIEEIKAKLQAVQEEKEIQSAEHATAQVHFDKVENENASLKAELSRAHVENALLTEKNDAYKKQIKQMKSEIKEKAYVYAEKLSAGEDELRKEQVKLQKKVQMQNYHIEQANAAVEELTRQLQAIQASFSESE